MASVKAVIFLPVRDNDGRDLTDEREEAENDLFMIYLGWTFLGMVQGAFRMTDGSRDIDDHRAYAVMTDEVGLVAIEYVLRRFKSKTTQGAIYLEVQYNVEMRLI